MAAEAAARAARQAELRAKAVEAMQLPQRPNGTHEGLLSRPALVAGLMPAWRPANSAGFTLRPAAIASQQSGNNNQKHDA